MGRWDETDPYFVTPEEEAVFERQAEEQETNDWLASWSDDFNSDEWLEAHLTPSTRETHPSRNTTR